MPDETNKPRPRYLDANYDRYKRSKRHEDRLAKRLGGKRLPRSGGMAWSRHDPTTAGGDISVPEFLIEHKRTVNKSMSLERAWLEKVSEGARRVLKHPAVIVTFERQLQPPEDWVLIPLRVFEQMKAQAEANDK